MQKKFSDPSQECWSSGKEKRLSKLANEIFDFFKFLASSLESETRYLKCTREPKDYTVWCGLFLFYGYLFFFNLVPFYAIGVACLGKLIHDRLPVQYNEGFFWGNGSMGSLRRNGFSAGNHYEVEIQLEKGSQYLLEILQQSLHESHTCVLAQ